jgi:hypothetical protein
VIKISGYSALEMSLMQPLESSMRVETTEAMVVMIMMMIMMIWEEKISG